MYRSPEASGFSNQETVLVKEQPTLLAQVINDCEYIQSKGGFSNVFNN